jgi:hypothetical protein
MTPHNLHDVLNGVKSTPTETMVVDDDREERSPLKKRSGSIKSATKRTRTPQVTPSKATTTAQSAPSFTITTTFLDSFNYPYPCTVVELAIALKSEKAFEEFTQALMAFITNTQMVNGQSKVCNQPLEPNFQGKEHQLQRGNLSQYDKTGYSH